MFKSIISELTKTKAIFKPLLNGFHSSKNEIILTKHLNKTFFNCNQLASKQFSTTSQLNGLMDFFDNPKNWGSDYIKHGREWRLDELRLKSNVDLHKLWFVLLKERNMLLTMEEEHRYQNESFPNPERIAKVDLSMENILHVVKERNIAFNLLETGESKEIIPYKRFNSFGFLQTYKPREYYLPWYLNTTWKSKYHYKRLPFWSKWYRNAYNNMLERRNRIKLKNIQRLKENLKEKYPELADDEYLQEYFETKLRYQRKRPTYSELLEKRRPDDVPEQFKEKNNEKKIEIYEQQF